MKRDIRLILFALGVVLLLGNTNCSHTNADGSATFVTTLALEDANGNQKTDFSPGDEVRLVLNVRNRTNSVQQVEHTEPCFLFAFAVVTGNSSDVVFYGDNNTHCQTVSQGGQPLVFQPGETMSYSTVWDQDVGSTNSWPAGTYEAMGGLLCPDPSQCFSSYGTLAAPTELSGAPLRSPLIQFTIQ